MREKCTKKHFNCIEWLDLIFAKCNMEQIDGIVGVWKIVLHQFNKQRENFLALKISLQNADFYLDLNTNHLFQ